MRIGIDMSLTAESKHGLPSYACSLVAALARVDQVNDYLLYPFVWHSFPPEYQRAFCPKARNFRLNRARLPKWLIQRLWAHSKVDRAWLVGGDPDVYFSPFHSVPPVNFRRLVCVFHDISFRIHPEFSTQVNVDHCEENFARSRSHADHMVTVSHFSKQEMVAHMGVPAEWITVTHEAADPKFHRIDGCRMPERIRSDIGNSEQVLLYVGSIEPRKNLATLIEAFDALVKRGRCKPTLILAGGLGWKNSDVHEQIERRGLKDSIYFTGYVSDEELVQLYNTCTAFVYPTIYEGFGLPVIEAMSCGVPVVTTRVASIPEVGGEAVVYVDDPYDHISLSLRIEEVLLERELQSDLRQRGLAQAATFTWERTARETLAVIEKVHSDPSYRRRGVEMGVDERGLGCGWHATEFDNGRHFRWSERQGRLRMVPQAGTLVVEAAGGMPGEQQILGVRVDGTLVGHGTLGHEWRTFRFPIDDRFVADAEVDVTVSTNFALPPSIKGQDTRELGARIARVVFE